MTGVSRIPNAHIRSRHSRQLDRAGETLVSLRIIVFEANLRDISSWSSLERKAGSLLEAQQSPYKYGLAFTSAFRRYKHYEEA